MKHTWRIAVVAAMVVASSAVLSSRFPARAVGSLETGYWWQGQPDGAPLVPPPNVPTNGMWVSGNETTPVAVSAVRFQLGSDESEPVLTAKVNSQSPPNQASSQANVGQVVILACPTTSPWKAVQAGAWSAKPQYNCSNAVNGVPSPDGTTVSFGLGPLAANGTVDVALVPGTGAAALPLVPVPGAPAPPQPSGFDVTFQPVTPDQVHTVPTAGITPDTGVAAPVGAPSTAVEGTSDVGAIGGAPAAFNFAANAISPSAGTAASSTPGVAPSSLTPQTRGIGQSAVKNNKGYRWLAGILLAVLLWWAWRQAVTPKRNRRTIYDGPPAAAA